MPLDDNFRYIAFVLLPVWIAVALWFAGLSLHLANYQRSFKACWFLGSILLITHIVSSYAIVHNWSHAAAIQATRLESLQVTGIAAGWGVYVNFAFAAVWLGYSVLLISEVSLPLVVESIVGTFQALIIVSATIIFEQGLMRWLSLLAFCILAVQVYFVRRKGVRNR